MANPQMTLMEGEVVGFLSMERALRVTNIKVKDMEVEDADRSKVEDNGLDVVKKMERYFSPSFSNINQM